MVKNDRPAHPNGANPKHRNNKRIVELDGVRGLAILLVLVWHYAFSQLRVPVGTALAYAQKLLSMTWIGVDLFFVLSGFLIGGILLDNRTAKNYFSAFYLRRALRIFPLYYLLLACFALLATNSTFADGPEFDWLMRDSLPMWAYFGYLQNFVVAERGDMGSNWMAITWSLAVEEQFYLVLPALIYIVSKRALPWILGVLVVVAVFFRIVMFLNHHNAGLPGFVLLPGRWDALFIGVLGAYAVRQREFLNRIESLLPWLRALVLSGSAAAFAFLVSGQGIGSVGMTYGGYTIIAITSLGAILLALYSKRGWINALVSMRPIVWLGTVSYGVYLLHQPVSGLVHGLLRQQSPRIDGLADLAVTGIGVAVTLVLASASWRYFEKPLVEIGHSAKYGT
jgi:peptidoglycan/LPS O-acetylase OafA/YrhL